MVEDHSHRLRSQLQSNSALFGHVRQDQVRALIWDSGEILQEVRHPVAIFDIVDQQAYGNSRFPKANGPVHLVRVCLQNRLEFFRNHSFIVQDVYRIRWKTRADLGLRVGSERGPQIVSNPEMISLLALIALNQEPPTFTTPPAVAQTERLALTPKLDGKIEPEEWDGFSAAAGVTSFLQWEPGRLFAAAKLPAGKALVLSLDLKANGWLVGKDNLEVRVRWLGDRPECKVRGLDATGVDGPVWVDATPFQESIACAAVAEGGEWTVELSLQDPSIRALPVATGRKLAARFDGLDPAAETAAFLPRVLAPVETVLESGSNVPGGLKWKPQIDQRGVAPGAHIRLRMTFNGANTLNLAKAAMRTEGLAEADTAKTEVPFPTFDDKGRAFVDYATTVAPGATEGYRIMRTTLTDAQGQAAILRTSYFIAPSVVLDLVAPGKLKPSDKERKVRFSVYARSNTNRKINGVLRVQGPEGWSVESGDDKAFLIANPFGSVRRVFDMVVPAGAKGTFPLKLQADLGGKSYAHAEWVTVG